MTSRLDRLLLLLDTGSSTSVRSTAAKQLAQLAAKSVTGDVAFNEEDVKSNREYVPPDPSAWTELMSVVARILPFLHSKSFETRTAASVALNHIFTLVPLWRPTNSPTNGSDDSSYPTPTFPIFSVGELISQGKLLLASSGKEFQKPVGILSSASEVRKARKEAMGRLGLDFLDTDDMDLDKEFAAEMENDGDVDMEQGADAPPPAETKEVKRSESPPPNTPSVPSPTSGGAQPEPDAALSARERNRLKRKRKAGNSAFVAAPPQVAGARYNAMPAGTSNKTRLVASDEKNVPSRVDSPQPQANGSGNDKVVVDPTKGGAVSAKAVQKAKALEVEQGVWIWDGLAKVLEVDLFSAAWEIRHGAAMALRELFKVQGQYGGMRDGLSPADNAKAHEQWCNDIAANLLCVFVLDRFGDFVSDQVVAPVRETVSQTLAALLIHMPKQSVINVHNILLQMIQQNFTLPATEKGSYVWEVRHAGLLGIKYEVAVRNDLFDQPDVKEENPDTILSGKTILTGIVEAAILGLGDKDDDVRSVAASCLLPITNHLVQQLPESLSQILLVLWQCLSNMKDDLSSSVGSVMDLLGKLVSYDEVIAILANETVSLPLTKLAPTLFPFFRHTIATVRLAVVTTLTSFMVVPSLSKDWIATPFLQLLFQNLVAEERLDIRRSTLNCWRTALSIMAQSPGSIENAVTQQTVLEWYAVMMTPLGLPIDTTKFFRPTLTTGSGPSPEHHNVDRNMLTQDPALISSEMTLKARIAAATALACLLSFWPASTKEETFSQILLHYIDSSSMLQKFLTAVISEEWAQEWEIISKGDSPLIEHSELAKTLSGKTLGWLQGKLPAAYHEMAFALSRIHGDSVTMLNSFSTECKLPSSSIPFLGNEIDITATRQGCFTLETAQNAVGSMYTTLEKMLGRTKKKELATIADKRTKIIASIERYTALKNQYDIRVSAAFAAAFVAFKSTPDKVSPVVKGIMNGIKTEENIDLQTRSANAVSLFIAFCSDHQITQPPDKIVKNLCTFLCQDVELTPTFAYTRKITDGILSFREGRPSDSGSSKDKEDSNVSEGDAIKTQLSRRGARLAFEKLSERFGPKLFTILPSMWQSMVGGLLSTFKSESPEESDVLIEKQYGQDVIDSLSVLEAVVPTFHPELWPKLQDTFAMMQLALRSKFAIIRQSAARCFATICDVMTPEAMHYVIEHMLPFINDPVKLANRQGTTELIYHIVQRLDIKALPYVIFLVVPVLGRMSDSDDDIRSTATNTFASLVKMVPLEAGLPDPPGFSEELLKRRETERQFLTQLLDGTKVEQYNIPVEVKAELRKYQQDGVNWLAFLAKYQLHGILCDDMGLGKTLQSICILASKHHERSQKHKESDSPDSVHLPSLIICPPTLTGHWYYEIQKYVDNLRPVMYTGNARERAKLLTKLSTYDIVITSYEVVRNDIAGLEKLNWLYCILDEGHVIKNAKTKLTKAVKLVKAQHRLILSGTPIQNNVLELWSLFDFLMPGFLGSESSFNERFSKPILSNRDGKAKTGEAAALALEALHKQVLPFLLRRLKEDVLNDLPPKIIQDYYCELSELQKHLYDDFSKSKAGVATQETLKTEQPSQQHVFQSLQYLRKLCNHPALVFNKDKEAIKAALSKVGAGDDGLSDIQHAPKLLALRQLLSDCGIGTTSSEASKGDLADMGSESTSSTFSQHRVLIFCQMKQMINIIETDLFKKHMPTVTYMRLDGETEANKRHAIVQTFNADPSIDCLLLTTHVGGLGLTLTGADTVIFVEHDWNPMKDLQAMDRAHRIGQKKVVNVYRLITKGTLEEKIMGLQQFKLNIANSVVTQQNSGLASMDTDLVLDLFRQTTQDEDAAAAAKKAKREVSGPISQKSVLQGLEELPEESEYEGLDLSSFMSSLK